MMLRICVCWFEKHSTWYFQNTTASVSEISQWTTISNVSSLESKNFTWVRYCGTIWFLSVATFPAAAVKTPLTHSLPEESRPQNTNKGTMVRKQQKGKQNTLELTNQFSMFFIVKEINSKTFEVTKGIKLTNNLYDSSYHSKGQVFDEKIWKLLCHLLS